MRDHPKSCRTKRIIAIMIPLKVTETSRMLFAAALYDGTKVANPCYSAAAAGVMSRASYARQVRGFSKALTMYCSRFRYYYYFCHS